MQMHTQVLSPPFHWLVRLVVLMGSSVLWSLVSTVEADFWQKLEMTLKNVVSGRPYYECVLCYKEAAEVVQATPTPV